MPAKDKRDYRLTDEQVEQITALLKEGKRLPDGYRFLVEKESLVARAGKAVFVKPFKASVTFIKPSLVFGLCAGALLGLDPGYRSSQRTNMYEASKRGISHSVKDEVRLYKLVHNALHEGINPSDNVWTGAALWGVEIYVDAMTLPITVPLTIGNAIGGVIGGIAGNYANPNSATPDADSKAVRPSLPGITPPALQNG